jgi:hypothetical protein
MTFGSTFVKGKPLKIFRSELTVYRGAYEAFMKGSKHARGYDVDIPAGSRGQVALITHESSHGVVNRNYYLNSKNKRQKYRQLEHWADDWINKVWDNEFK